MRILPVVLCTILAACSEGVRLSFPPGFKFGAATAAYQIEGGWNASDKGLSIWDKYTHDHKNDIKDGASGDVACDSYHLWETDVNIAANLSLDFYRFSISWTRLLPTGLRSVVSEDGKNYYSRLIDGLLAKGIEPVITLYHWGLPQRLQDLGGWTNPYIVDWFADYADVVFSLYGDRVKTWITLNEPVVFCDCAYSRGFNMAPGIMDVDIGAQICSKNAVMAHAKAYRLYERKYRWKFHGKISLANQIFWYEGLTEADNELAELAMEYVCGRYSEPIYSKKGGWPTRLEKILAEKSKKEGHLTSRMPSFTQEEIDFVRGTYDFFALNHYSSRTVRKALPGEEINGFPLDGVPELGLVLEGRPEWKPNFSWLLKNPPGFRNVISWIKRHYGDLPIMITENGYSTYGANLEDDDRIEYFKEYLEQVLLSIHKDGVNIIGYAAWTMIDNFEWMDGYTSKFGLYEVNFTDPMRTRTPRKSAHFYADVIKNRSLDVASETMETELSELACCFTWNTSLSDRNISVKTRNDMSHVIAAIFTVYLFNVKIF